MSNYVKEVMLMPDNVIRGYIYDKIGDGPKVYFNYEDYHYTIETRLVKAHGLADKLISLLNKYGTFALTDYII